MTKTLRKRVWVTSVLGLVAMTAACRTHRPFVNPRGPVVPPGTLVNEGGVTRRDSVLRSGGALWSLVSDVDRYSRERGSVPATLESVVASLGGNDSRVTDRWGRRVRYTPHVHQYELRSAGADGVFETGDDIIVSGQIGRNIPCDARTEYGEMDITNLAPACSGSSVLVLPICLQPVTPEPDNMASNTPRDSVLATGRRLVRFARNVDGYGRGIGGLPPSLKAVFGFQIPVDVWGRTVRYLPQNRQFELRSSGTDGAFDTGDDIAVSAELGHRVACEFRDEHGMSKCEDPMPPCP